MALPLIDTHCHVQFDAYDEDRDAVLQHAREAGIETLIVVGTDIASSGAAQSVAARANMAYSEQWLYTTVGVHPHDVTGFGEPLLKRLWVLACFPDVVALGEMGLDYYRMLSPREAQLSAFEAQLELASDMELPVVVHSREAEADTLDVLSRWAAGRDTSEGPLGVMHCFDGSLEVAKRYVEMGFVISIPGPVTYANAAQRREVAAALPLETLVVETDSPYLSPQGHRGRRNEPAYLAETVQAIAELRGETVETVATATTANARRLFGLPAIASGEQAP